MYGVYIYTHMCIYIIIIYKWVMLHCIVKLLESTSEIAWGVWTADVGHARKIPDETPGSLHHVWSIPSYSHGFCSASRLNPSLIWNTSILWSQIWFSNPLPFSHGFCGNFNYELGKGINYSRWLVTNYKPWNIIIKIMNIPLNHHVSWNQCFVDDRPHLSPCFGISAIPHTEPETKPVRSVPLVARRSSAPGGCWVWPAPKCHNRKWGCHHDFTMIGDIHPYTLW